jgi:ATP-dependent exoDNAse (exonuclease V) beta subunit
VCIYRNEKIQKLLPPQLQELFTRYTAYTVSEALCVLYVELTRPVYALHMIIAPSQQSERKLPKTPAGLLRAGLTDGQRLQPLQTCYEVGDPQWYHKLKAAEKTEAPEPTPPGPSPIRIDIAQAEEGSRPDHQAPSSLEGGGTIPASRLLQLGGTMASARGTMIHAFFEQVRWLDDGLPSSESLHQVARRLNSAGLNIDEQIKDFHQMLQSPAISEVLDRSRYQLPYAAAISSVLPAKLQNKNLTAEVFNERRFVVREENRFLSGSIDRLVVLRDEHDAVAAEVLDFKTDAISGEDDIAAKVQFYRPQLDAYRKAVARMYRIPGRRITARLVFVSAGRTLDCS